MNPRFVSLILMAVAVLLKNFFLLVIHFILFFKTFNFISKYG